MPAARHRIPSAPVRLAVVPFLPEHQPALGVSSLAAVLARQGIRSEVRYLNVDYHQHIGDSLYEYISRELPTEYLLGEMVFARALWGDRAPRWDDYARRVRRELPRLVRLGMHGRDEKEARGHHLRVWEMHEPRLRELHTEAPAIVRGWAEEIIHDGPRVVGLTSTFQQNAAALALARMLRLEASREEMTILFGGGNCEDDMGRALAESFPFVDHVVSGEGEKVIVDLVESALGDDGNGSRHHPRVVPGVMVDDMDALPLPDFDDFFSAIRGTDLEEMSNLSAESARGCWWGARSHCTFCGLNGTTMAFRSKDPARFARELRALRERYGRNTFMMADNILDVRYIRTLFPDLISQGDEIRLFYETKSNLRKEQLELMAAGGVFMLQPGIETLSTAVLRLMGKGTTLLHNVQLLKWCEEFEVSLVWNILYGFPGESDGEYVAMADLVSGLCHLPAPVGVMPIRLDRFSPYWMTPERYGIRNLRPSWAYDFAFGPLDASARERLAYFFEFDYADDRDPHDHAARLAEATSAWHWRYEHRATLEIVDGGPAGSVLDGREPGQREVVPLTPAGRCLLRLLDSARRRRDLLEKLNTELSPGDAVCEEELCRLLAEFRRRRWLVEEGDKLLSLVLDRSEKEKLTRRRMSMMIEHQGVALPPALSDLGWLRSAPGAGSHDPFPTPRPARRSENNDSLKASP